MYSAASNQIIDSQYMGSILGAKDGGYKSTFIDPRSTQRPSTNLPYYTGAVKLTDAHVTENRMQYANAKDYSLRSGTLIDYTPGPQSQNNTLNADDRLGRITVMDTDRNYSRSNWAPNSSQFQQYRPFPTPRANPNRMMGIDNRQTAAYQVSGLLQNPLSAYRRPESSNNAIPQLFCNTAPKDYTNMSADGITGKCYGDSIGANNIISGQFPGNPSSGPVSGTLWPVNAGATNYSVMNRGVV